MRNTNITLSDCHIWASNKYIKLTWSSSFLCCAFRIVSAKRLFSIATRRAFFGDSCTSKTEHPVTKKPEKANFTGGQCAMSNGNK